MHFHEWPCNKISMLRLQFQDTAKIFEDLRLRRTARGLACFRRDMVNLEPPMASFAYPISTIECQRQLRSMNSMSKRWHWVGMWYLRWRNTWNAVCFRRIYASTFTGPGDISPIQSKEFPQGVWSLSVQVCLWQGWCGLSVPIKVVFLVQWRNAGRLELTLEKRKEGERKREVDTRSGFRHLNGKSVRGRSVSWEGSSVSRLILEKSPKGVSPKRTRSLYSHSYSHPHPHKLRAWRHPE